MMNYQWCVKMRIQKYKKENKKMEVHHHPHVEKKNFKEYFLEFLMIFLAVTLGFFAESVREYITEHKHAKEYAEAMINDLSRDTTDLKKYLDYFNYAASNVDTLMQLVSANDIKAIPSGKLYWYGLWAAAHGNFVPHDATLHQMESSGALRYFTNLSLNREVAEYDQLCRKWETMEQTDRDIYLEIRKARPKIFEFKYNDAANNIWLANKISFSQARIDSFLLTNPQLLTYDKTTFNEYIEMVRSRFLHYQLNDADTLLKHATDLIIKLKKGYHLKDE
jgi:hypothetical protein